MNVLFINNLGFTYSLIDEFKKRDCKVVSYRSNIDIKIMDNAIAKFKPGLIVISSGPEKDAGNSVSVIRGYCGKIPIFGVGLGNLCIIEAFDGNTNKSQILPGKLCRIRHDGKTIFKMVENPFNAGIYSSLSGSDIPLSLEVSARSENDNVMGVRHKEYFIEGIQFDPSSILTASGSLIIDNLLKEVGKM